MSDELRKILEELKKELINHYKERLVEVILFGSQARGEAVEGSEWVNGKSSLLQNIAREGSRI